MQVDPLKGMQVDPLMPLVPVMQPLVPPLVPLKQTCDLLHLHLNTGYRLIGKNKFPLPLIRQGKRYFCTRTVLLRYLEIEDPSTLQSRATTPGPKTSSPKTSTPATTLSTTERAALRRLRGLGPNVVPASRDVRAIVAAVDRLAG